MLFAYIFNVKSLYPDPDMYSCNGTVDTLYPNLGIGMLFLVLGVVYQIIYIPCIIVMTRKPLFDMPCFKIMVYMGISDVTCLFICADLAGIWQLAGTMYCHSPVFSYVTGNIAMGLWATTCFCCVFLAFNRTWELFFPHMNHIFDGNRIIVWLALPTLYFCYFAFFERPLLYNPIVFTFMFDPHTAISKRLDPNFYANLPHTINNGVVIISLLSFYPLICCSILYRIRKNHTASLTKMSKQIILQSMVICGCHIIGCFLYVYTQYFPVPSIFTLIGNLAWIGNHGLPGVVYISLNSTIRSRVLELLRIRAAPRVFTTPVKSLSVVNTA
ncbi:hypothetical protein Q1695_001954 [Nippostrongylus brasiliensis]|nr:hypothetical protein Q1695_001954 [Nippostrongylus brasiliensis]